MIIESCQILSTAHRLIDGNEYADLNGLYKSTHVGHPCVKWCMKSKSNYEWLLMHCEALSEVFYKSRGKVHGSAEKCLSSLSRTPRGIPEGELTEFPLCTQGIVEKDTFTSYKKYLNIKYKSWLMREKPLAIVYPLNNKPDFIEV